MKTGWTEEVRGRGGAGGQGSRGAGEQGRGGEGVKRGCRVGCLGLLAVGVVGWLLFELTWGGYGAATHYLPALVGRVVDADTGRPLGGVEIRRWYLRSEMGLARLSPAGANFGMPDYRTMRRVVSDREGRFRLPGYVGVGIDGVEGMVFKRGWAAVELRYERDEDGVLAVYVTRGSIPGRIWPQGRGGGGYRLRLERLGVTRPERWQRHLQMIARWREQEVPGVYPYRRVHGELQRVPGAPDLLLEEAYRYLAEGGKLTQEMEGIITRSVSIEGGPDTDEQALAQAVLELRLSRQGWDPHVAVRELAEGLEGLGNWAGRASRTDPRFSWRGARVPQVHVPKRHGVLWLPAPGGDSSWASGKIEALEFVKDPQAPPGVWVPSRTAGRPVDGSASSGRMVRSPRTGEVSEGGGGGDRRGVWFVLRGGTDWATAGVLERLGWKARIIRPSQLSARHGPHSVLVVPEGALRGRGHDSRLGRALDRYVRTDGGTLVVLAQALAEDFLVVPVPRASEALRVWGWLESTSEDVTFTRPGWRSSLRCDGVIESLPAGARVMWRAKETGGPAVAWYGVGAGRVVVTTCYPSWLVLRGGPLGGVRKEAAKLFNLVERISRYGGGGSDTPAVPGTSKQAWTSPELVVPATPNERGDEAVFRALIPEYHAPGGTSVAEMYFDPRYEQTFARPVWRRRLKPDRGPSVVTIRSPLRRFASARRSASVYLSVRDRARPTLRYSSAYSPRLYLFPNRLRVRAVLHRARLTAGVGPRSGRTLQVEILLFNVGELDFPGRISLAVSPAGPDPARSTGLIHSHWADGAVDVGARKSVSFRVRLPWDWPDRVALRIFYCVPSLPCWAHPETAWGLTGPPRNVLVVDLKSG